MRSGSSWTELVNQRCLVQLAYINKKSPSVCHMLLLHKTLEKPSGSWLFYAGYTSQATLYMC